MYKRQVQEAEGETEAARTALAAESGIVGDESAQQQALVEPIQARGATRGVPFTSGAFLLDYARSTARLAFQP